jgi:MtrB/PioB family decaheme-associated outer membrane protein
MKTRNEEMKGSILALAVRCALMATIALPLSAYAGDDADALTKPSNSVDFGVLYSSENSARFGQYNGLNTKGFYGLGGFDVRGGDGYDRDKNSALRWKLNGSNLGTTSRNLGASVSEQGKWKLNLGYDELRHNITDSYQTPFLENTGGNNFTLPANFGGTNGGANPASRGLTPTQLSAFHTEKEYSTRRNGSVGTTFSFTDSLSAQIDYNHLEQSGAKLIGTGSQAGINLLGGSTGRAEAVAMIMNPTSSSTDNINAALNWVGNKAHLTAGYYGSLFHDDYNSLNWQTQQTTAASNCVGINCYVNNSMSTAPSNSFHQANLSGGYDFSSTTKLVGGFSYGYNKQNDNYAPTLIPQISRNTPNPYNMMQANGLPTASLNGVVETTHGDIKLTNKSIKDLNLSAGFKFDERDNRTDSNTYKYMQIANVAYTGVNTPYSNRKLQYEAAADYRLAKGQNINLTYLHESLKRWCSSVVGGAECVSSPASEEDKISLTYRLKLIESVNFNAGYTYADRRADTANFLANAGNYAVVTPVSGSAFNAGNYQGFVAYPYASRSQNVGKAGVNWQVTQKLDLALNGRYSYDDYDAQLGVQNGQSAAVNVDATYNYTDDGSVSAYWSWQNGQRNLTSGAVNNGVAAFTPSQIIAPKNIWSNKLDDNSQAFGLLAKQGGLLNGKLELIGDLSYSLDTTTYATDVPYLAPTCATAASLTCGVVSPIKNELISLKLTGNYKIVENGKLSLSYMYQKLNSNDYFYNSQQFGYTPNRVMPNGLQDQDYTVNVVALSYNHKF